MSSDVRDRPYVHIVDDDESLRHVIVRLLRSVGVEGRAYGSTDEFLSVQRCDAPGCILLDVRLPGMGGLEFQAQLSALGIRLPVVLMTGHGDISMSVRAMKAGAVDFLSKPFRDQDMIDAVGCAICRDRDRRAAEAVIAHIRARFSQLSAREQQVMELATTGRMNKQIAGDLGISEVTVKIHRGAAMRKMEARTIVDLVRMSDAIKSEVRPN